MDKDTVVSDETDSGERLTEALVASGFEIRVAFWAKPTDEMKWFLYLASPVVDDKGPAAAYRFVYDVLRKTPNPWIDPFDIKVIGLKDSLTGAILEVVKPLAPHGPFAVQNPKAYPPGVTRLDAITIGGISIDGAYIYPPLQLGASA